MAESVPSTNERVAPAESDWVWDEDVREEDAPQELKGRRFPLGFLCSMAVLGVVLALVWRYAGASQLADQLWARVQSAQAASTAQAPAAQAPAQTAEIEALKAEIGKLTAANRQLTADISALQGQQQELTRRAASPNSTTNLFSNPALLKLQIVPRALTTGSAARAPTAAPPGRAEVRNRPAPAAPKSSAPIALAPPNDRP